jgi:hypothetical protein
METTEAKLCSSDEKRGMKKHENGRQKLCSHDEKKGNGKHENVGSKNLSK